MDGKPKQKKEVGVFKQKRVAVQLHSSVGNQFLALLPYKTTFYSLRFIDLVFIKTDISLSVSRRR